MRLPRVRLRTLMLAVGLAAAGVRGFVRSGPPGDRHATSKDPKVAVRQEKRWDGVPWGLSYEEARERARLEHKPILIYFTSVMNVHDRRMQLESLRRAEVVPLLSQFAIVRLDIDTVPIESLSPADRATLGEANLDRHIDLTGDVVVPCFVVMDEWGEVLASLSGYHTPGEFSTFLKRMLANSHRRSGPWRPRS